MGAVVSFEDFKKKSGQCEVLTLFAEPVDDVALEIAVGGFSYPTSRPHITGNLGDLFEQASAVVMRHRSGDRQVSLPVAEKCLELIEALSKYAKAE